MTEREFDGTNLVYHPQRTAEWLERGDCFPLYVEIGPTNRCNHKCSFCALDYLTGAKQDIDRGTLISALESMASCGVKSVMFAGEGEPLLHRDIISFVRKAYELGIVPVLTTNGALFGEEKMQDILPCLAWIRFSVDAATRQSYAKVHGVGEKEFDKTIANIASAVEFKKKNNLRTDIGMQFLMIPENTDEIMAFASEALKIGVDNIQIKPYSQHPLSINRIKMDYSEHRRLAEDLRKIESSTTRVIFRDGTMQRLEEQERYFQCHALPFFALIDSGGNVLPCNLFYNRPESAYGNLYNGDFRTIWLSSRRKKVIREIRKRGISECRKICRLDTSNDYLEELTHLPLHKNVL